MKELIEFRVLNKYVELLPTNIERKENGSNSIIKVFKNSSEFAKIGELTEFVREKYNDFFFLYHNTIKKYSKKELAEATLFHIKVKSTFEPAGEECGTKYAIDVACEICGANRSQIGPLMLLKSSIPKKDIARTIAGEVIVSNKFKSCFESYGLKGAKFEQVFAKNNPLDFYQILQDSQILNISPKTIAGIDPFDLSETCEGEVYKCPNGHTIGLNLLSEVYIQKLNGIDDFDFYQTQQKIGVSRGLLKPEPLYLGSQSFRRMVLEEKLKGFDFEIAKLE